MNDEAQDDAECDDMANACIRNTQGGSLSMVRFAVIFCADKHAVPTHMAYGG